MEQKRSLYVQKRFAYIPFQAWNTCNDRIKHLSCVTKKHFSQQKHNIFNQKPSHAFRKGTLLTYPNSLTWRHLQTNYNFSW